MNKVKLTFRYQRPPGRRGRDLQPGEIDSIYPLIPVRFYYGDRQTPYIEALLDSGCDGIFLQPDIVDNLKLPNKGKVEASGIDGLCEANMTEVGLRIGRGNAREYDFGIVDAAVPIEKKDVPFLIGRHPVFDEYQIIFEEYKRKFKLIPKEIAK